MDAKVKCSNCGAEITNLTFSWAKNQWLWTILAFLPLIVLIFWVNLRMFRSNHDFTKEIQASLMETRVATDRVDVLGELTNQGNHTWYRVTVEAEFYNERDEFLDEASEYLSVSLTPGTKEHFRITLSNPTDQITNGAPKVILKVTNASEDRF